MSSLVSTSLKKDDPAVLAFSWLLDSGIQETADHPDTKGGVNAWFDLRTQSYPFVYSEITGYAVNAFLFYYSMTKEASCLDAACSAADWLLGAQYPENGLIRTRFNHRSFDETYFGSWVFTFDQWIIIYSLANLSEVTGRPLYLRKAESIAQFLMKHTTREDGLFYPIFDVQRKGPLSTEDKWSRQPGSFHAKALMALDKLYELTKNGDYLACALRLAEKTLSIQESDGRFVTQSNEGSTHLHPHLYSLEGLLSFGLARKNEEFIKAAERGFYWMMGYQREDGTIYSFFRQGTFLPYVRADILAQALRLGAILFEQGFFKGDKTALERLRKKLLQYQITQGPQKGGFLYGQEENGAVHEHVNAWVTMFAGQALWLYDRLGLENKPYVMSFFV